MSDIYYEPKHGAKPVDCVDSDQYFNFIDDIAHDVKLTFEQRTLLKLLATRFLVFKYEKLADYYIEAPANVQKWLERLRCVIVDTDSAIKNGYIQYKQSYNNLIEGIVNEK